MQKTQKRLGRGLSSLISVPDDAPAAQAASRDAGPATRLSLDQIRPNPFQPRREMDAEELQGLADSIRQNGLIQPVLVRPAGDGAYELIAGERRWRACRMAGVSEIAAVVREADDQQMLELAMIENIFREDLNAIDRAEAYRRYCEEFNLSAEDVAARLGEDRTTVTNYLRLLDLPDEVRQWVAEGKLAMGHARCLLGLRASSELVRTARQAIDEGLSVRALEKRVRERIEARHDASKRSHEDPNGKRPQIRHLEQVFTETLSARVEIAESRRKGSGRITIHYASLDDFDRISERLGIASE